MNPSKHSRSLYFTPRTPWGRFPQNRPGQSQNYLRASQDAPAVPSPDEKHKLWGTEQQGLGAQMATSKSEWRNGSERTLDRLGVPRELSGQITPQKAAGTYDKLAMFPPSAPPPPALQNPQPPQSNEGPLSRTNLEKAQQATLHQWRFADPVAYPAEQQKGWAFGGKLGYSRERPKNGPLEASAEFGAYSNKELQEKLEQEDQENRKIFTNETGEEPEVNYYGR